MRIVHSEPPLLRRVDEKDAAKRPEGLPAQPGLGFLLDQNDPLPGVGQFRRRDQPGQSRADDDDIRGGGQRGPVATVNTRSPYRSPETSTAPAEPAPR